MKTSGFKTGAFARILAIAFFLACSTKNSMEPIAPQNIPEINVPNLGTINIPNSETNNQDTTGLPVITSIPGYDCPPNSMTDFRWPWRGIRNMCGGEAWYIYAGYTRYGGSSMHYNLDEYAVDLHKVGEGSLGGWVLSAAWGTVAQVAYDPDGYGYYIKINHGNGYQSLYGHLRYNPYYIHVGDVLTQGTFLGYCGSTGYSTGPHVHFRITRNGQACPLSGISGYGNIVRWGQYYSANAYVIPPRGYNP